MIKQLRVSLDNTVGQLMYTINKLLGATININSRVNVHDQTIDCFN